MVMMAVAMTGYSSGLYANEFTIMEPQPTNILAESDDQSSFTLPTSEAPVPTEATPGTVGANNGMQDQPISTPITEGTDTVVTPGTTPGSETGDSAGKVILTLDVATAQVEGETVTLASPPTVIKGVTLLPLRFIGDHVVGAATNWDPVTKTVTIIKGDTTVVVTIDSNIATVNGMEVELPVPPQIINNTTLLPLRFISEAFNIPIDYNKDTKQITLVKSTVPEVPNKAPVASFYFPDTYIAGQTVSVVETSTDPDGDAIVERLWSVEGGPKRVTNKELSNMFKTPRAGTYTIGLQVKDAKGLWSDWAYQSITILPNQAPTITSFMASKSSYAQGEEINFSYTYDNETWETVKEGKWTYRSVSEASNRATVGKPGVLFTPGDYIITLYLDDAYGNRSQAMETRVTITEEELMSELEYRFTKGKIGDWIDNFQNLNYLNYSMITNLNPTYDYGTLIMSDSPEMVTGDGILYRDSITGTGRLLIHHINNIFGATDTQKLAVIMENPTTEPVTVTLKNKVIKGPSTDILRVGQLALNEYLKGTPAETITLNPGERKFMYNQTWTENACISGHVDVETSGKTNFIVAAMGETHTLDSLDTMTYYPPDGAHYSGTYNMLGIHYNVTVGGNEPQRLTLGVASVGEWAIGYDERTQGVVENTGNYGITYYVTVTAEEDMGVILNNRGGIFQGAIKWQGEDVYNMPGNGSFNGTTTKAVVMGTIQKGETKTFEYLLPNGSATPTLIAFIPKSQW